MGTYYRDGGSWLGSEKIECFRPDDTENELYLESEYEPVSLADILTAARKKWPDFNLDELHIEAKHIHTSCIGYGRYDREDHTNYLRITRKPH